MRIKSDRFLNRHNGHANGNENQRSKDRWAFYVAMISICISSFSFAVAYKQWTTYQAIDTFKFWVNIEKASSNQTKYSNLISKASNQIRYNKLDQFINRKNDIYQCTEISKLNATVLPFLLSISKNGSAIIKSYDLTVLSNDRLAKSLNIHGWSEFRSSEKQITLWWGAKVTSAGALAISLINASAMCRNNGDIKSKVKMSGNFTPEVNSLKAYMLNDLMGNFSPNASAFRALIQSNK